MKIHNNNNRYFVSVLIVAYATVAISFWLLSMLDPDTLTRVGREDSWIESAGASFFLIASILMMVLYRESSRQHNTFFGYPQKRNVYYLLLSLLFFVCFGEEISWGQRIFGWDTPQLLQEINAQKETNIHNLWWFQARNPDGSAKTFMELFLNANRLLSLFWLVYCVLVPISYMLSSRLKGFIEITGMPVPSILVGGLFLVNYLSFRSALFLIDLDEGQVHALDELKESNYGLAFAILALYFLRSKGRLLKIGRAG